jgi:hypothetical protein
VVADKLAAVETLAEVDKDFDQDQDRETETALGQFLCQSSMREHLTSVLTEYLFLFQCHYFLLVRPPLLFPCPQMPLRQPE